MLSRFTLALLFSCFSGPLFASLKASGQAPASRGALVEGGAQVAASIALSDAIQPRREGAFWIYTSMYFEGGRAISNGTTKEEILEVRELQGQTCYQVRLTMDWRSLWDRLFGETLYEDDYDYFWEYCDARGSFNFSGWDGDRPMAPATLEDFELTLPYPVEAGVEYEAEDSQWEVLDLARSIEVPAGRFSCVVYQSTDDWEGAEDEDKYRSRFFMAPGVGLVRFEGDYFEDGAWVLDMCDDLVKYDLNTPEVEPDAAAEAGKLAVPVE